MKSRILRAAGTAVICLLAVAAAFLATCLMTGLPVESQTQILGVGPKLIQDGSLRIGSEAPDVALTDGALFLSSTLETDGAARFDGAVTFPGGVASIGPAGAAAFTIGTADTTAITLTTDDTGDGTDVVLPVGAVSTGEILNGTLLAADSAFPGRDIIQICGDLTTVSNNTVYYGPDRAVSATTASGTTCDTAAAGDTTEATADAPAFQAKAFHVLGMTCRTVDLGATTTFTLRSAAAATVPSVTCSIADNELDCVADVQTTTAIASGATVAIAAASAGDLGTAAFVCNIAVAY